MKHRLSTYVRLDRLKSKTVLIYMLRHPVREPSQRENEAPILSRKNQSNGRHLPELVAEASRKPKYGTRNAQWGSWDAFCAECFSEIDFQTTSAVAARRCNATAVAVE